MIRDKDIERTDREPEPVTVGTCPACLGDIHEGEDCYDIYGEVIHEDCLHDWARKFKMIAEKV